MRTPLIHLFSYETRAAREIGLIEMGRYADKFQDVPQPQADAALFGRFRCHKVTQEAESAAHVPIMAMTACAMKGDEQQCLECGMDSYISKPIRRAGPAEMIAALTGSGQPAGDEAA